MDAGDSKGASAHRLEAIAATPPSFGGSQGSRSKGRSLKSSSSWSSSSTGGSSRQPAHLRDPPLPDDLKPLSYFPLVDQSLISMRTREDFAGRIPKMRCRPVITEAAWVPGSKQFHSFRPEFYME